MNAELALSHLHTYFERVCNRKLALSLIELKNTNPANPPAPAGGTHESTSAEGVLASPPRRERAGGGVPASATINPAPDAANAPPPPPPTPLDIESLKAHPLVKRAAELLNAKVIRITARPDAHKADTPKPETPKPTT